MISELQEAPSKLIYIYKNLFMPLTLIDKTKDTLQHVYHCQIIYNIRFVSVILQSIDHYVFISGRMLSPKPVDAHYIDMQYS